MVQVLRVCSRPGGDYATTVAKEVHWLVAAAQEGERTDRLPGPDGAFFAPMLDYAGRTSTSRSTAR